MFHLEPMLSQTWCSAQFIGDEDSSGYVSAAAADGDFDFGVDPNIDPELALALRVSMEEERARQEAGRHSWFSSAAISTLYLGRYCGCHFFIIRRAEAVTQLQPKKKVNNLKGNNPQDEISYL